MSHNRLTQWGALTELAALEQLELSHNQLSLVPVQVGGMGAGEKMHQALEVWRTIPASTVLADLEPGLPLTKYAE